MTALPTTLFDVYDALTALLDHWPSDPTGAGEEFLDNDFDQTSRWALILGNVTDGGGETDLATDPDDPLSRTETFSVEWAVVQKSGDSGHAAADLRAEMSSHLERLQALISADPSLGGACTWCSIQVEFLDHGAGPAGSLARMVGAFEIVSLVAD